MLTSFMHFISTFGPIEDAQASLFIEIDIYLILQK